MMNNNKLLILAIGSLLFASCEKVINVDLNTANPQYVVEGNVFEGTDTVKVHVAKTTDYYGKAPQQQVNDATVTLSDDAGNNINIPLSGNGWYMLPNYTAQAHKTYHLKVVAGGNEFTSTSTIPGVVPIDSITYEYKSAEGFLEAGYEVICHLTDPAAEKNNYRLLLTVNDTLQNKPGNLYLFDDKYNNGKHVKADFFKRFNPGDTLDFEIRTMDDAVYKFYTTLDNILNNQNGPAPANPVNNISGGALGYFGAFSRSKASMILPE